MFYTFNSILNSVSGTLKWSAKDTYSIQLSVQLQSILTKNLNQAYRMLYMFNSILGWDSVKFKWKPKWDVNDICSNKL